MVATFLAVETLWQRELVRFWRQKSRVLGVVASPLIFWAVNDQRRFTVRAGRAYNGLGLHDGEHVGEDAHTFYRLRYPESPELSTNLERAMAGEEFVTTLRLRGRTLITTYVPVRETGAVTGD